MRIRVWAVALTITVTASAGLLLLLLEPVSDVRWPFVYAAAGSALLSAAAGVWDWAQTRRSRHRLIANLRAVGQEMADAGHFPPTNPDAVDEFLAAAMAYDRDQQRLREGGVDR